MAGLSVPTDSSAPWSAVAPMPAAEPAALAHEARVFRILHQQLRQQHAKAVSEARSLAEADEATEAELVFTMDRAQFAEDQLKTAWAREASGAGRPEPWQLVKVAEAALLEQQQLRAEMDGHLQSSAETVSRLRVLRGLAGLSGRGGGLASVLRRSEDGLLAAGRLRQAISARAAELQEASSLCKLLPLLQAEVETSGPSGGRRTSAAEAEHVAGGGGGGGQGRWLLAPAKPADFGGGRSTGSRAGSSQGLPATERSLDALDERGEDPSLQHLLEELTERRTALRRELQEEGRRQEAAAASWSQDAAAAALRGELAEVYEELARLQDFGLEEEIFALKRRLGEAKAQRAALAAQAALAASASMPAD